MKERSKYRLDMIIIGAVLLLGVFLALFLFFLKKDGSMAQVRVDGKIVAEYPLDLDAVYELRGVNGGTNQLMIRQGKAEMIEASCPDGLCVNMGKISAVGQSIICLPNKVVVEITADGVEDENGFDIFVGK